MNRVTGSGAFIAVCRSAWLIAGDPNDAEKRRRILAPIKNTSGTTRPVLLTRSKPHPCEWD